MVQPRIPLLLLLLLCISAAWLVTTQQVPPEQVREYALKSLANINSIQLAGPDDLLSMGWKGELPGRNWRRLATKLATPGSEVCGVGNTRNFVLIMFDFVCRAARKCVAVCCLFSMSECRCESSSFCLQNVVVQRSAPCVGVNLP